MDLYLQAMMIQMRLLIGDLLEKVGDDIKPLRKQQLNLRICGEELITMWENTEIPDDWQYPKRKIKIYLEKEMMPYETEEHSIHPGRHFLPTGLLRRKYSLPYYQIEKIIQRGRRNHARVCDEKSICRWTRTNPSLRWIVDCSS